MLDGSCCDLAPLCIGDEGGRRRGGGGGRRRRRGREREVGTFEVGWSLLNETEEKKELQPVCVCVCVCVCMRGGKRAPKKKYWEGLGTLTKIREQL